MLKRIASPFAEIVDIGRKIHVRMQVATHSYLSDPRQKRLFLMGAMLGAGGMFMSRGAHAEGFADMLTTAASQADTSKAAWGKIMAAGGVGAGSLGAYNWFRKGKEGEGSRISGGQIFGPLVAGAAMGAVGAVMIKAGETIGIPASGQGQIP